MKFSSKFGGRKEYLNLYAKAIKNIKLVSSQIFSTLTKATLDFINVVKWQNFLGAKKVIHRASNDTGKLLTLPPIFKGCYSDRIS